MKLKKKYAKVIKEYEAKNYDAALRLLHKMKANDKDYYCVELAIFDKLKNTVKEYRALKKLLPMLSPSSPEDKETYEGCLIKLTACCSHLGLTEEALKFGYYIMNSTKDRNIFYVSISSLCFDMNSRENCTAADFQAVYDEYERHLSDIPVFPRIIYNHDKIRVGFLSGDFCNHVVMRFSWGLLTKLDKNAFEVYCYSSGQKQDEINSLLRVTIKDNWRDIYDLTDEAAAKLIRDDEIDILFDLSGHTKGNRLAILAYRPASIQISGIGFTNSTGLKTVDYFLTDVHCIGDSAPYFTENFIILPHSHICLAELEKVEHAAEPPCFKNGYVTFGSFNQYRKITDPILIAWKKILDAVPNSRLLLKNRILGTSDGKNFVINRLKQFKFDLNRVELRGHSDKHPLDYDDMDIALDTFPYTGVTTTCEALYMGVPVVSLYGNRHSTRCGLSILNNVGLYELAVDSYDEYVNRAVALAGDWELLTILKKNLRTMIKKSPLMDKAGYVREAEQAFIQVLNTERNNLQ